MSGQLNTVAILQRAVTETRESCHGEKPKCLHTDVQSYMPRPHSEPPSGATLIPEHPHPTLSQSSCTNKPEAGM